MEQKLSKDKLFDINGSSTGLPVNKKLVLSFIIAALALIICSLLPLEQYGEKCAVALGWLVATLVLLIMAPFGSRVPATFVCGIGGVFLGLWDANTIKTTLGSSSFIMVTSMIIVASGAELTPMGRRIAYWFLNKFGKKPIGIVLAIGISTAILSSFVSNIATIIMMSGIAHNILLAGNEVPGKSKLGRTLMLVVSAASMVGGVALISGSPVGNTMCISLLETATGGAYTVSYSEWAKLAVPCFLVALVPMCLFYVRCSGLKNSDCKAMPEGYYKKLLKDLGPVGGSEIRWLIITVGMVACLCLGMNMTVIPMLFAVIAVSPVFGCMPIKEALAKLPMEVLIPLGILPIMGNLFSNSGLSELISSLLGPAVDGLSPLMFSIVCALAAGIIVNVFVNAGSAANALIMGVTAPLCVSMGYNPVVVLLPTMLMVSMFFVFGANAVMMLNKGYGYWEDKDSILPGTLLILFCGIIFPVVCCLIGPIFGFPLYI